MQDKVITREALLARVQHALQTNPITAILGPRQCGKTTLARQVAAHVADTTTASWFDLEDPLDRRRLATPMLTLQALRGLVILDEVQQMPELFTLLRVLADRPAQPAHFLILGSASPDIIQGVSESLAGRVAFVDMQGFGLSEINDPTRLWTRGGLPRAYLAEDDASSMRWRRNFLRTFLNMDLAMVGPRTSAAMMGRFWTMLAHYHGQTLNASELGRSLGISDHTVRHYLDLLSGTFIVRQLLPWFENVGKRVVKAPKIYLRDSGLLHALLDIDDHHTLLAHPKLGASWEGFALEQTLHSIAGEPYFWGTHSGAEVDLFILTGGKRWGFEFKYADAPGLSKSMLSAYRDLRLQHLWVIYPGTQRYPLSPDITVLPLRYVPTLNCSSP